MRRRNPVGFVDHDHHCCIAEALHAADSLCEERRVRFTAVRRRVLEILLESHAAMGAYDLLDRLRAEGLGSKPPVAYRALRFLLEQGLVHRVERLNAYIACAYPGAQHAPAFLICTGCGAIAEASVTSPYGALEGSAQHSGFKIKHTVREAEGHCPACQSVENA